MTFWQNFGTTRMNYGSNGDVAHKQKWSSVPHPAATVAENINGSFDCNICLESSHDPVVTLCGHLFCWPCIYKWLQVQTSSLESDNQPKCPVCKAYISKSWLIPLYGGGGTHKSEAKKPRMDLAIPQRPPAPGVNALLAAATSRTFHSNQQNLRNPFDHHHHHQAFHQHEQYVSHDHISTMPPTAMTGFSSPTINMVGEMVFARIFGRLDASLFTSPYSNSYLIRGGRRLRRQEMQLDKSLNRVSIFLFCCIILCLVLF